MPKTHWPHVDASCFWNVLIHLVHSRSIWCLSHHFGFASFSKGFRLPAGVVKVPLNGLFWYSTTLDSWHDLLSFYGALQCRCGHYIFILWFLLVSFFFSSPNLSGRRLDVYDTSTHGVAVV